MSSGQMLVFNWQWPNGRIENWWAYPGQTRCNCSDARRQGRRFVFNAFKAGYAIAVNLDARALQITKFGTNERVETLFTDIEDPDLRDAMDVVAEADNADVMFVVSMYLYATGRDELAVEIAAGATDDLPKDVPA